ncbi:cobalamin biosynthesis protein CobW [Lachnospiraceae bacterium OF09-6]|nr:cobalamin biosynthesis protein CobW [Lachnospiraceae bacterium OF09-6]
MTKVDIISGFLGAGKTTLIKKLLKEVYANQQVVLIENEFGEIGIDGGFLKEAGINITEMNSGCICCSLVGDFGKALKEVTEKYHPDRIIIEPSGVGKLSDVRKAVEDAAEAAQLEVNSLITVANAAKIKMYMRTFGEFYNNQVENAGAIILSRTQSMTEEKQMEAAALVREKNPNAVIITTPWDELTGQQILDAIEGTHSLAKELMEEHEHEHHHHDGECGCGHDHDHEEHEHHHEHHHDGECGCGHDHDHEEHEHHHEHHHDGECGCGHDHDHEEHEHHHDHEHEHHYDENGVCSCGHHHDHDHHHHHADEVFTSWGKETPRKYSRDELEHILKTLNEAEDLGMVLRAKGMLPCTDGTWMHFDLVPGEYEIRTGAADYTGRLCVIGSKLKEEKLEELFLLK